MLDIIFSYQFAFSFAMSIIFIMWQYVEYKNNSNDIELFNRFFAKKDDYQTDNVEEIVENGTKLVSHIILTDVAEEGAELKSLIRDINEYIRKSKGTVAFSIIQNKTERRIAMLYEAATSRLSFPTHIGLMGTFAGVFVGLCMFLYGSQNGITDNSIYSLIMGVLVSMATSFFGILLLIKSHKQASEANKKIDTDKNEFYEWIQNELMPSVDVSMVEAIGKLHETIDQFEPAFSGIINEFKTAFNDVTGAFGNDFRDSVQVVANAVDGMGKNMDKINENIQLENKLLEYMGSQKMTNGMNEFVMASEKFSEITGSLNEFEKARRLMLLATKETIDLQKEVNNSLIIPKKVAVEINQILDRITTFEKNINALGVNISHTQLVGNALVEDIKQNINAIKGKQKIAEEYAETADKKLELFFDEERKELSRITRRYNEALDAFLEEQGKIFEDRKNELEKRKEEFTRAIDEKFSVDDIRKEFTNLSKLSAIVEKLDRILSITSARSKEKSGNVNKSKRKEDYDRNTDERNLNKTLSDFDKSSRPSDTDPQLAEILRKAEEDRKIEKKVKEIIEKPIENKDEDSIAENVDENQNSADNSKGKGFFGSIKKVFGKKKK
jgi:ABC-type transporter Mla subunit MlaD